MGAGCRTKDEVVAEFRQGQILDAARQVFAARGYECASVDHIARAAGVSKGTVYLYYRSKRAVYQAALRAGLESLCDELERRVAAAEGVRHKLRAFVETKLAYFEAHHDFFRIYTAAYGDTSLPLVAKDWKALHARQLALLERALGGEAGDAELRASRPQAAAFAVFDLTRGAIIRRLFGRSREATEQDVAFLLELIWKGLAAA